jgi:uncharacterized membrane protein YoaT (DUF817 family)
MDSYRHGRRIAGGWARMDVSLSAVANARGVLGVIAYEFLCFGVKQAWACLFGGCMVALLLVSGLYWPKAAPIARYDALTLAAVAIQFVLVACRLETRREAWVIFVFHLVGTAMEVFKTAMGSWTYPEASLLRIGGVPLFTGFMYAAVGSYIARAWRLFDFRFTAHPPLWAGVALAVGIYLNFFTHHYVVDARPVLFMAMVLLFGRTWVHFRIRRVHRRMPLLAGLGLVAVFIWLAENVGTFTQAWVYPSQKHGWQPVAPEKIGAWLLLMTISYVMVWAVHGRAPGYGAGAGREVAETRGSGRKRP